MEFFWETNSNLFERILNTPLNLQTTTSVESGFGFCKTWIRKKLNILHVQLNIQRRLSWECHCVKNVRIRSFSGPYFPAFGLNTERYTEYLSVFSTNAVRTRKTAGLQIFKYCIHDLQVTRTSISRYVPLVCTFEDIFKTWYQVRLRHTYLAMFFFFSKMYWTCESRY